MNFLSTAIKFTACYFDNKMSFNSNIPATSAFVTEVLGFINRSCNKVKMHCSNIAILLISKSECGYVIWNPYNEDHIQYLKSTESIY